jgi:hypothetical protein
VEALVVLVVLESIKQVAVVALADILVPEEQLVQALLIHRYVQANQVKVVQAVAAQAAIML